jgi:hypothetical protein
VRPTTSNIFHTSLAFHPSSLAARNSTRVGNRVVGSQWCRTTGSSNGTGGMGVFSWVVVTPALWRIP